MATAICAALLYLIQIVQGGELVLPQIDVLKHLFKRKKSTDEIDADSSVPRVLMNIFESVESFLIGMGRIFPALIVLTLAWASGAMMVAVGADRLFARKALATGTSWVRLAVSQFHVQ